MMSKKQKVDKDAGGTEESEGLTHEEIGNLKGGPQLYFFVGDDQVLLRPYVYGWELCWKRRVKDRENEGGYRIIWCGEKYYGTLPTAMSALFEYKLRACDVGDLTSLKTKVEEIRAELVGMYNTTIEGEKS